MKKCYQCGVDMTVRSNRQKYCSTRCSMDSRNLRRNKDSESYWYKPDNLGVKTCESCSNEFIPNHGRTKYCSSCRTTTSQREYRILKNYGLTSKAWNEMFAGQGNVCAICSTDSPGGAGHWHTDHDHISGNVRGILCDQCNKGLGNFKDSVEFLTSASIYLLQHENTNTLNKTEVK